MVTDMNIDGNKNEPIQEVIDNETNNNWTVYLFFCICTIGLASFQDGYQIGCINAPGPLIIEWIKQSHEQRFNYHLTSNEADFVWSVAVSMFSVGGVIGGLLSGIVSDKIGRRGSLIYNNLLAILASVMLATAKMFNFYPLIVMGRLLVGLNCGITSGLVPLYLVEIAPTKLRGKCGSFHQLNISIAIVLSQALGLPFIFGTQRRWPMIFGFVSVPAILQLIGLQFCPESPKFLVTCKKDENAAKEALKMLRNRDKVDEEISEIKSEIKFLKQQPSYLSLFKEPHRWSMIISILMMFSQQFSGISAVTFYSTLIFKRSGLTGNEPMLATVGFGCVKLVFTVISIFLVDHHMFGRKRLHMLGLSGMCISSIFIVITLTLSNNGYHWASYLNIFFTMSFVIMFAFGPGPVPWFFTAEVFPSQSRGKAAAVSATMNWIANWVVGLTFLPLTNLLQQYAFLIFTLTTFTFVVFTYMFVPETKGKTPSDIRNELHLLRDSLKT